MDENNKKSQKGALTTGILAAIAASSCCIPPVIAAIAGVGGAAGTLSWMEPLRPYLIGLAIIAIGYAWYNHLKPKKADDCGCDIEKPKFYQTKSFLVGITLFAALSISFPYYSDIFYPKTEKEIIVVDKANIKTVTFEIEGMTCASCEEHVRHEVNQLDGILKVDASFDNANAIVEFDKSKTTIEEIENVVNTTGYRVTEIKE